MVPSKADAIVVSPWERFHKRKLDFSKNLKAGFGEYCQAHDNDGDNTLNPRTTGAITVYDTGARDGTWYLFNLNTRKLIKRKKFTIIPMPDVVINFLNNLHDIDEAGDESDINFQIGRDDKREIDGDPEETNEDEAYQDYVDQVAKRFITVRDHDMIYDPVEASQPDMIEQTEASTTSDGVDLEGVVEADALQPDDNAGNESPRKEDHLESYEPRRDGLRSARAKPGRYTRKEVGMHLLRDLDSSHRREYGFYMTPKQAIDKLGIIDGKLIVELDEALYGLKESALPWYQLLCDKLETIGFVKNRYEQCVFNRVETDGSQSSLCVHVDDFMISAVNESMLDHLLADMNNAFGD
eukprot:gene36504-biopygen7845